MIKKIYNSSNKIIGDVEINFNEVIIHHDKLPDLIINDPEIVSFSNNPIYNDDIIIKMFDDFYLTIGEIAALSNVLYHRANKWIKTLPVKTGKSAGRRGPSFGKIFSPERRRHIAEGRKRYFDNGGQPSNYKRTPEIREKIKLGVQQAINDGRLDESSNARKGWENNKFQNVNFKRGIGCYIYSIKNKKRLFLRSLLELQYAISLEEDPNIKEYLYEPFKIKCDNGSLYTPNFQINSQIKELKSYNFIYKQGEEIQKNFEYKVEQARKYCEEHNLQYEVIYDKDINFDSKRFKQILRNSDYITKYQIEFLQPERIRL